MLFCSFLLILCLIYYSYWWYWFRWFSSNSKDRYVDAVSLIFRRNVFRGDVWGIANVDIVWIASAYLLFRSGAHRHGATCFYRIKTTLWLYPSSKYKLKSKERNILRSHDNHRIWTDTYLFLGLRTSGTKINQYWRKLFRSSRCVMNKPIACYVCEVFFYFCECKNKCLSLKCCRITNDDFHAWLEMRWMVFWLEYVYSLQDEFLYILFKLYIQRK